jgi:hypothetical protein
VINFIKKEQDNKLKKLREADETRKNKLRMKEQDNKEFQNESRRQYHDHLRELKVKQEERERQEREQAMANYIKM